MSTSVDPDSAGMTTTVDSSKAPRTSLKRRRIACFPELDTNPYQRLLYGALSAEGFETIKGPRMKLGWLLLQRRRVDILHLHWPERYYRFLRGPARLRHVLSWLNLAAFLGRLTAARALRYRIVWTVHQVFPHEPSGSGRLDRTAAWLLARVSHELLAHDIPTARDAEKVLRARGRVSIAPHGSFLGVYPPGRSRAEIRRRLGVPDDAFVFLSFGFVRAYKQSELLFDAFEGLRDRSAALVVAGIADCADSESRILAAAKRDPRVFHRLEFIPDEEVRELFEACDAAIVARGDGGTSGSIILALSLGLPVVAADRPAYRDLLNAGTAGWLFEPGDPVSLRQALLAAASNRELAQKKGEDARAKAEFLSWDRAAKAAGTALAGARR